MITTHLRRTVRVLLWLLPVAVLLWVADRQLAFTGRTTLRCTPQHCDQRFSIVGGPDALLLTRSPAVSQSFVSTKDPLSFDTILSRSIDRATIQLTYQHPSGQESLRVGVQVKGSRYTYDRLGDRQPVLTALEGAWSTVRDGDLALFQRPGARSFDSVAAFLNDLPPQSRLATYGIDLSSQLPLPGYRPIAQPRVIEVSTRGPQTLLTYVGPNEDLADTLTFQDINRHAGKDDVTVRVKRGGTELGLFVLRDDGNIAEDGQASGLRDLEVRLTKPGQGTYELDVETETDDPFLRRITLSQGYLIWGQKLYLAGSREYAALGQVEDRPITVYVRGTKLTASTSHAGSLQTIAVGPSRLTLTRVGVATSVELAKDELVPVTVPIRDVVLETDGSFTVDPTLDFVSPQQPATSLTQPSDIDRYDYVLAEYRAVRSSGDWLVTKRTLDHLPAGRTKHFVITMQPPLGTANDPVRIRELNLTFEGQPFKLRTLWDGVQRLLKGGSV